MEYFLGNTEWTPNTDTATALGCVLMTLLSYVKSTEKRHLSELNQRAQFRGLWRSAFVSLRYKQHATY